MSDPSAIPDEPVLWMVAGLLVAASGLGEWLVPHGAERPAPLPSMEGDGETSVRNVYGLTPVDLALVADWLTERADGETRYVVAGYPGPRRLNGPLLTRSTADRQMARDRGDSRLVGRPIEGGWRQLTVEDRDDRRRRPMLSGARVDTEVDGERRPCPRLQLERFACAPPGWSHVRRRGVSIGGDKSSCIWSHPIEETRIVVDFGPVEARSNGRSYRVRTGLADGIADEPGAVEVDIRVGNRRLDHRHRPERGWQRTQPLEIEGAAPLTVAVSAERVGRRHFCFDVD